MDFRNVKLAEVTKVYNLYCLEEKIEPELKCIEKAKEIYSRMLEMGSYTFGCFIEEELVGVINVNKILDYYPKYQEYPYVHLETCIVHENFRNKGIGTLLLKEVIAQLKRENVTYIIAQSSVAAAQRSMEKAGLNNGMEVDYRINYVEDIITN